MKRAEVQVQSIIKKFKMLIEEFINQTQNIKFCHYYEVPYQRGNLVLKHGTDISRVAFELTKNW